MAELQARILMNNEESYIIPESGSLVIWELMDYFMPMGRVMARDFTSIYVTLLPILQATNFGITLDDQEQFKEYAFKAFSSMKNQVSNAGQPMYDMELHMIGSNAEKLLLDSEFHSMRAKASDYVKYIADKLGFEYDVEDTKDTRSWINPKWTYAQMLKYLAGSSVSAFGNTGYQVYVTSDNILTFKTIDTLFDNGTVEDIVAEVAEDKPVGLTLIDNHFSEVLFGANNLHQSYYNLQNSELIELQNNYETIKPRGLFKGVSQEYAETGKKQYYGEIWPEAGTTPIVLNQSLSTKASLQTRMNQVHLIDSPSLTRKIGDVVDLTVPTQLDYDSAQVDFNYSGRYLIKGIVTFGNVNYYQKLLLTRAGINLEDAASQEYF